MAVDKKFFFDTVRKSLFGGSLTDIQVSTLDAILNSAADSPDELAYTLATPYHEVGPTLAPVTENLNYTAKRIRQVWPSRFKSDAAAAAVAHNPEALGNKVYGGRLGNDAPGDGFRYRGRGFSQITGKGMYEKFGKLLNIDLVGNPDLALVPATAAKILVIGMQRGLFTGKKLDDFVRPNGFDFVGARSIINADGKANGGKIADIAVKFRKAIRPMTGDSVQPVPVPPPAPPIPPPTTKPTNSWIALGAILVGIVTAILKALGIIG